MSVKVATCCYCGTRAALVLKGRERHELSCQSCGAPLHELKRLKAKHPRDRHLIAPSAMRKTVKRRKRKGFLRRAWEEFADEIEDLIEDFID